MPIRLDKSRACRHSPKTRVFLISVVIPDGPNGGDLLRLLHALVGKPLSAEAARFATEQDEASKQARSRFGAAIKIEKPEAGCWSYSKKGACRGRYQRPGMQGGRGSDQARSEHDAIQIWKSSRNNFQKPSGPKAAPRVGARPASERTKGTCQSPGDRRGIV